MVAGPVDPSFTFSYSGFVNGEGPSVLTSAPTCSASGNHTIAGTYPITCTGGSASNYDFTYQNATLTVIAGNATQLALSGGSPTVFWNQTDWYVDITAEDQYGNIASNLNGGPQNVTLLSNDSAVDGLSVSTYGFVDGVTITSLNFTNRGVWNFSFNGTTANLGASNSNTVNVLEPPIITGLSASPYESFGATFYWNTDEPANGTLYYSTDPTFNTSTQNFSVTSNTSQQVLLEDLQPSTQYYYYVVSCDEYGMCNTSLNQSIFVPAQPNGGGSSGGLVTGSVQAPVTTTTLPSTTSTTLPFSTTTTAPVTTTAQTPSPPAPPVNNAGSTPVASGAINAPLSGVGTGPTSNGNPLTGYFLANPSTNPWYVAFGGVLILGFGAYSFSTWTKTRGLKKKKLKKAKK
jgi:hypothetical protein